MYRFTKIMFVIIMLSVVTHESMASDPLIFTGGSGETAYITFILLRNSSQAGQPVTNATEKCEVSLRLDAFDALAQQTIVETRAVQLTVGNATEVLFPIDNFGSGNKTVLVKATGRVELGNGQCSLFVVYRLESASGETVQGTPWNRPAPTYFQTQAEVVASLDDTVTAAEAVLTAIQSGADKDDVMALFKTAKQTAKTIESSVVLAQRDRSLGKLKKAHSAYKKGEIEKSEELMVIAIDSFKMTRKKFHDF